MDGEGEKLLDRYFDTFKHYGTLNVATAVLVVAVIEDIQLVTMMLFVASLLIALGGMDAVIEQQEKDEPNFRYLRWVHYFTAAFYFFGLGAVVSALAS